ncbi:hypothetical protein ATO6_11865 [Oceanicola sp. 22II-s10i]|nr:hypothetical protein ATO6_11865 [Oceanicola sp. 22II-s10i]
MKRIVYAILILGIAICFLPLAGVIYSTSFADKHGCTLHEGFPNPCIVDGVDHGEQLYTFFVSGWFMLMTLPIALLLGLILLIMIIVDLVRRRRRRRG